MNENPYKTTLDRYLRHSAETFERTIEHNLADLVLATEVVVDSYRQGGKMLLCGNGGSAGQAQHIATEMVCRFQMNRASLPALALTTDTSVLTAIGNDFGFEEIFARQIESMAAKGDVLFALSTSGNSPNVLRAMEMAAQQGVITVGMTGGDGGKLGGMADIPIIVPAAEAAQIQEAHLALLHALCVAVESTLFGEADGG